MTSETIDRQKALSIIEKYIKNINLFHHMLAVEACMRWYAKTRNADQEKWGLTGLLHDFDWEIHPSSESHPCKGAEILRDNGVGEEIIKAILTHGNDPLYPRITDLEKYLYACDELTGFITAVALVRPSKSLSDLEPSSIKKKWKDKAFAAAVNRFEIENATADIGIPLWTHVANVITAMREISAELGL